MDAQWHTHTHIYIYVIFGSDNGLLTGGHQAIIWTNAGIFLIKSTASNFIDFEVKFIFIQENAFENVICKMAAISPSFIVLKAGKHWFR